ncbi:hypothetical protein [Alishewanella jeotgali]|uniref:hypothetical protein n=1 Tax=Alishewanella jeotgali TaxID=545533 RepID=UPI0005866E0C|nr:hypothetical protein [Alishewanella jeotgali]
MTQPTKYRILWIWVAICSLHALFLVLAVFTTAFVDTPLEGFVVTALAVPYFLHHTGLPVLQNGAYLAGECQRQIPWVGFFRSWPGLYGIGWLPAELYA